MDKIEPTITSLYSSGFGVIGQTSFTTSVAATTQSGLYNPSSVFVDSTGNLWVADYYNNRVLMYEPPFTTGMNATLVIGQTSFTAAVQATTQRGLAYPYSAFVDSTGNLWVADYENSRVLMYEPPFTTGMNATLVIGQTSFTTSVPANTQSGLSYPYSAFVDSTGNLWVADGYNSRVLMYKPPFTNGMNATLVIGQTSFTTSVAVTTQSGLNTPYSAFVDSTGNLWVADEGNSRVLMYKPPFTTGMNATLVIGQTSFTAAVQVTTQSGLFIPYSAFVDSIGNLWVADFDSSRVIMYEPPFTTGMNATLVIGQTSFTAGVEATTQSGLYNPSSVFVDSTGNLWVADYENSRVLMYEPPFTTGMNAGTTAASTYSIVVYPRSNMFYNPKAGLVKL